MEERRRSLSGVRTTVIAMILLGCPGVSAQERADGSIPVPGASSQQGISRLALGIGAGTVGPDASGFAFRGAFTMARSETRSITVRSTVVEEFLLFGASPAENVWDFGVLYGAQSVGKRGYGSIAAGLAVTGGTLRGDPLPRSVGCTGSGWDCVFASMFTPTEHEEERFVTLGVPVELEAGLTFSDSFGIGLNVFANLNAKRTSTGMSLNFLLGRIR